MKGNTGKYYLILSTGDLNQIRIRKSSVQGSLRENSLVSNLIITKLLISMSKAYEKK